ncbi:hypothetical protein EDC01DRAFT_708669 [Geopyxis carbonaria]|nr:hypothetical protein EDC01DRAFT_708669 [Geopyxis carbonaria]
MATNEKKNRDWIGLDESDADDAGNSSSSDREDQGKTRFPTKRRKLERAASASEVEDDDENTDDGGDEDKSETEGIETPGISGTAEDDEKFITNPSKLKPLTPAQLAASKAATQKTGVVYLSRVPPFMKPSKVKDLLSRFGLIGRIFLAPEDPKAHAKRVKFGGNKKRNFEEGWVEFMNRKHAKLAAETLNARIIGGKKGSFYHDDLWNIKYLPKFKWHHLQAQISYENASRQSRMRAEIAKETKINKNFLKNYERAKMIDNMQETKKKRKLEEDGNDNSRSAPAAPEKIEVRRQFRQNKAKGPSVEGSSGDKAAVAKKMFDSVF